MVGNNPDRPLSKLCKTPPEIILDPEKTLAYSPSSRRFTGIPSVAVSPAGSLWAVWYSGKTPAEDKNNYAVLSASYDSGRAWREILAIDPDGQGPVRAFDPELWFDPDGTLHVFWAQTVAHDGLISGVWEITTDCPDSREPLWSSPRRLEDGVMMCKPLVLSCGEWVLPVSTWRETDNSAKIVVSCDSGKTWQVRGGCNVPPSIRSYDEHMLIEKKDGKLWMLIRNKKGIGESLSCDGGKTWSEFSMSSIENPDSRLFIRRLSSDNLLLVKNGPVDIKTARSHLQAFISRDDGLTWEGALMLDEREGVSYPDGDQDASGIIYVVYDRGRKSCQEILLASFTEDDVLRGSADSTAPELRMVISKCGASKS